MNNKKLVFGTILAVVFLFSIGMTYAYFSLDVYGNDDAKSISVSTGTLDIFYYDGPEIEMLEIYPGSSIEKTLFIDNYGTFDTGYYINWSSLTNEITNDELIITLSCVEYSLYYDENDSNNELIGSCGDTSLPVGASIGDALVDNVPIAIGYTHVYNINVEFIETGNDQNYNQGKTFSGVLNVGGASMRLTSLRGVLMNEDIPMANVTMTTHSTPITTTTNENGEFFIENIEYGVHELEVKDSEDNVLGTGSFELKYSNEYSSIVDNTIINWNSEETNYTKLNLYLYDDLLEYISIDLESIPDSCFETDYYSSWTEHSELFIKGYNVSEDCGLDVIIPNEISGRELFGITELAFEGKGIRSVRIPPKVVYIGFRAFANNQLTNIIIPNNIREIAGESFKNNQLTSVTLPSSLEYIGYGAFENNRLKSVTMQKSVVRLGGGAFNNNLLPDSQAFIYDRKDSNNDGIGEIDYSTIVSYGGAKRDNVSIPLRAKGVYVNLKNIYSSSFRNNQLTSVTIPYSVEHIYYNAFENNELINITIPSNVLSICFNAFNNNRLLSVIIEGKSSSSEFSDYQPYWGWDENATCVINNTSNVTNGCITWGT